MESKFENMLRGRKFVAMLDHQTAGIREKYDLKSAEVYVIMYPTKAERSFKSTQKYNKHTAYCLSCVKRGGNALR